jgi:hypothetical protein
MSSRSPPLYKHEFDGHGLKDHPKVSLKLIKVIQSPYLRA